MYLATPPHTVAFWMRFVCSRVLVCEGLMLCSGSKGEDIYLPTRLLASFSHTATRTQTHRLSLVSLLHRCDCGLWFTPAVAFPSVPAQWHACTLCPPSRELWAGRLQRLHLMHLPPLPPPHTIIIILSTHLLVSPPTTTTMCRLPNTAPTRIVLWRSVATYTTLQSS